MIFIRFFIVHHILILSPEKRQVKEKHISPKWVLWLICPDYFRVCVDLNDLFRLRVGIDTTRKNHQPECIDQMMLEQRLDKMTAFRFLCCIHSEGSEIWWRWFTEAY